VLETALHQWQDGERRFAQTAPSQRRAVERVIERIVAELRWRLGNSFATQELVALYEDSTAWSMGLALQTAPGEPLAWEQWVSDAAFFRHLRRARDWPPRRE
jgi:quinol monooxygenase YgiN